jgi:hypothetical protein
MKEPLWFRGHGKVDWKLVPSLLRSRKTATIENERRVYLTFRYLAMQFVTREPLGYGEWMLLMQHYGAPTRLLDWTTNPLIGLYFAVSNPRRRRHDGCIYLLEPHRLNVAQRFATEGSNPNDFILLGPQAQLQGYDLERLADGTTRGPVAVVAPRIAERVAAQAGVFTLFDSDRTPLEERADGSYLTTYRIPRSAKDGIRAELKRLGIERQNIFPGLDSVGERAAEAIE